MMPECADNLNSLQHCWFFLFNSWNIGPHMRTTTEWQDYCTHLASSPGLMCIHCVLIRAEFCNGPVCVCVCVCVWRSLCQYTGSIRGRYDRQINPWQNVYKPTRDRQFTKISPRLFHHNKALNAVGLGDQDLGLVICVSMNWTIIQLTKCISKDFKFHFDYLLRLLEWTFLSFQFRLKHLS